MAATLAKEKKVNYINYYKSRMSASNYSYSNLYYVETLKVFHFSLPQHFKDLIRLRRTAEWPRSAQDTEVSATKESPEIEPLPFTLAHERCISVVQKLALFLLSMDFTCHADLLLFVCKVPVLIEYTFLLFSFKLMLKMISAIKCSSDTKLLG